MNIEVTNEAVGSPRPPKGKGVLEPLPPELAFMVRTDAVAMTLSVNGAQHRAVLAVGDGGLVRPGDVAAMLRGLATAVEG